MKESAAKPVLFRPLDVLLLLAVLALAVLLLCLPLFCGNAQTFTVTTAAGSVRYPLAENRSLTLEENGYTLTLVVEGGAVFVSETTCPEQVCLRTGRISRAGESILCSRAGVLIRIEGEGDFDAVAG